MKKYKLVWSDEFNYSGKPDHKKWNYDIGTGRNGWGNGEAQYYTDNLSNVKVENGKLIISANKEMIGDKNYTSCRLTTFQKKSWKYGRFEIKAKLPSGRGTWPAIWMLPDSFREGSHWPSCGEIDIMEHVGRNHEEIHFSLHTEKYNHIHRTQQTKFLKIHNVTNEFREYAIDWTEDYIEFFIDGETYYKVHKGENGNDTSEAGWPFDQPFYLIINLAIGGYWGGEVDESIFPQNLEIEYVRVYEIEK